MGMTPYPGGQSSFERPSILCSDDKLTWAAPAGLTNPIVGLPSQPFGDQNSDVDIVIDQQNDMHMTYRVSNQILDVCHVMDVISSDGVNWAAPVEILTSTYAGVLAQSIEWDGSQYVMYSVNADTTPNSIERRTSNSITSGWSDPITLSLIIPARETWHIEVIRDGADWFMLIYTVQGDLFFSLSHNGIDWIIGGNPVVVQGAAGAWDSTNLYRSTFVRTATGFDIWYTGFLGTNPSVGFTQLVYP